ncbi:MAG: branched-chain amino acid ABC transporter permease [Ardenticatenales bacterium]|nr:branched-chain amino acid ABC transporter permease [Ardenticatenales bacterium]
MAECVVLGKPCFLLAQWLMTGVMVGSIYSLVALGLVLIVKASGIFNFAHGYLMLLGSLFCVTIFQALGEQNLWLALLVTALLMVAVGFLIERAVMRPLLGQPLLTTIMMTLALTQLMQGLITLFWGVSAIPLNIFVYGPGDMDPATGAALTGLPLKPLILESKSWLGGNIIIKQQFVLSFLVSAGLVLLFTLFFRYSRTGLVMRAVAENPRLAQAVGLRVYFTLGLAWAIAALLGAAAGIVQSGGSGVDGNTIPLLALRAFPAVLLGGLESIPGAILGGIIIGVVEVMVTGLVDSTTGQEFAPFLVLILVLLIRPQGLFGQREVERI